MNTSMADIGSEVGQMSIGTFNYVDDLLAVFLD